MLHSAGRGRLTKLFSSRKGPPPHFLNVLPALVLPLQPSYLIALGSRCVPRPRSTKHTAGAQCIF